MTEKMDRVCGVMRKLAQGTADVLGDSLVVAVKASGKSFGYAERVADGICQASRELLSCHSSKSEGISSRGTRKKTGPTKAEAQSELAAIETGIRDLYLRIGRLGRPGDDPEGVLASAQAREWIEKIKKWEQESAALQKYLLELEASAAPGVTKPEVPLPPREAQEKTIPKRLPSIVESCLRKAVFSLHSDAVLFEKALRDLLEAEMEIKRLAVSELGKLGNRHAGPALKEALSINDPELQAEIINALLQIEDGEVIPICQRYVKHPYAGVRAACVRGLYKAGQAMTAPFLIEALGDEHIEVRHSAAMFLGWLEYKAAVPALLQTASSDKDSRVRKSALQALENIRDLGCVLPLIRLLHDPSKDFRDKVLLCMERIIGETVSFLDADNDQDRQTEVNRLKEWWIRKKHNIGEGE